MYFIEVFCLRSNVSLSLFGVVLFCIERGKIRFIWLCTDLGFSLVWLRVYRFCFHFALLGFDSVLCYRSVDDKSLV